MLFLHCPCNGRLGGRWQRQVLDTGLRGDPPAVRVLDALLEANECILWRGRTGIQGSSECFHGISQSDKVIGQDWTPCSMFLWALYSVRMLYHRVSRLGKAFWTFELMDSIDSIVMQRSWHRSKVLKSWNHFRIFSNDTAEYFSHLEPFLFLARLKRSPALWRMWQSVHTFFTYGLQHETSYMKNTFISPRPNSWSFLKCESLNLLI